jgi:hypothetical protein
MEQAKPPPPYISPTGMWATKLALRVIQFALAIAIIGCVGSLLSTGVWSIITLIVITPQVSPLPFLWSPLLPLDLSPTHHSPTNPFLAH